MNCHLSEITELTSLIKMIILKENFKFASELFIYLFISQTPLY